MSIVKSIDLSDENYSRIFAFAESFDDSPDVVIGRLLDRIDSPHPAQEAASSPTPKAPPAEPGTILPEGDYWVPILKILTEAGGAAPATNVIDVLEQILARRFKSADHDRLNTGETRWKNRARFARLRMKEQGLLSDSSKRGIWMITDEGRRFLESREEVALGVASRQSRTG